MRSVIWRNIFYLELFSKLMSKFWPLLLFICSFYRDLNVWFERQQSWQAFLSQVLFEITDITMVDRDCEIWTHSSRRETDTPTTHLPFTLHNSLANNRVNLQVNLSLLTFIVSPCVTLLLPVFRIREGNLPSCCSATLKFNLRVQDTAKHSQATAAADGV